jgi:hypothetical protein
MAGLDDITNKAKDFLDSDAVKNALKSDQAEDISDKLLDGVADAAKKVTSDKFEDQIDGARNSADKAVGND